LAPIADALPQAWQPTYADLAERHGVPEDADFASYSHGGWIGPTSPASIDELRQLSVNELVEFLRNWVDPGQPMSASPEGLSRVLTGLVTEEVARFAREASAFQDLDPTYVRGILGGFTSAARAKATFE
jgi:hypothetical protein